MSTMIDLYDEQAIASGVELFSTTGATPTATSAHITTTLYDLVAALQSVAEPDEDALVIASVVDGLCSGRITFLGDTALLEDEQLAS